MPNPVVSSSRAPGSIVQSHAAKELVNRYEKNKSKGHHENFCVISPVDKTATGQHEVKKKTTKKGEISPYQRNVIPVKFCCSIKLSESVRFILAEEESKHVLARMHEKVCFYELFSKFDIHGCPDKAHQVGCRDDCYFSDQRSRYGHCHWRQECW